MSHYPIDVRHDYSRDLSKYAARAIFGSSSSAAHRFDMYKGRMDIASAEINTLMNILQGKQTKTRTWKERMAAFDQSLNTLDGQIRLTKDMKEKVKMLGQIRDVIKIGLEKNKSFKSYASKNGEEAQSYCNKLYERIDSRLAEEQSYHREYTNNQLLDALSAGKAPSLRFGIATEDPTRAVYMGDRPIQKSEIDPVTETRKYDGKLTLRMYSPEQAALKIGKSVTSRTIGFANKHAKKAAVLLAAALIGFSQSDLYAPVGDCGFVTPQEHVVTRHKEKRVSRPIRQSSLGLEGYIKPFGDEDSEEER